MKDPLNVSELVVPAEAGNRAFQARVDPRVREEDADSAFPELLISPNLMGEALPLFESSVT